MSIIDWHTHWLSPRALQTLSARNTAPYVRAKDDSHYEFFVNSSVLVKTLPIGPSFFDGPTRIAHLDEVGIDTVEVELFYQVDGYYPEVSATQPFIDESEYS